MLFPRLCLRFIYWCIIHDSELTFMGSIFKQRRGRIYSICEGDFQEGHLLWFWFIPYLRWTKVWFLQNDFWSASSCRDLTWAEGCRTGQGKLLMSHGTDLEGFSLEPSKQAGSPVMCVHRRGDGGRWLWSQDLKMVHGILLKVRRVRKCFTLHWFFSF